MNTGSISFGLFNRKKVKLTGQVETPRATERTAQRQAPQNSNRV